ncbi:hypothetical protein OUZ56_021661 [Daphnia magna]|uniref:Uncharacterized protein n=1 Tax=Daphnia magna TaxID=35525 RepID=A0ABR0AU51_9CRUS|nr:hypothetical protein OUZ56_021661 [Daphnia magna]
MLVCVPFYPAIEQSQVIESCTETEVVNNNSGIEIDCELHSSHVELVKPRDVDLQHLGADFVLNMLTEQKLTQVNVHLSLLEEEQIVCKLL